MFRQYIASGSTTPTATLVYFNDSKYKQSNQSVGASKLDNFKVCEVGEGWATGNRVLNFQLAGSWIFVYPANIECPTNKQFRNSTSRRKVNS